MVTTANSVKQYSPAELCAKPIGTKPAIVTSVPASIANGVGLERVHRGGRLVVAGGQPGERGVGRGHRVVDHQRQRDDQRTQRDPLHVDAEHQHDREHDGQRQRDRQRHDQAGPHAEAEEAHAQDDRHRLPQRFHELADGDLDRGRLVGDEMRLDADRQVGLDARPAPPRCCRRAPARRRRRAWRWPARSPARRRRGTSAAAGRRSRGARSRCRSCGSSARRRRS